jgi:hypothetical protein
MSDCVPNVNIGALEGHGDMLQEVGMVQDIRAVTVKARPHRTVPSHGAVIAVQAMT